MTTAEIHEMATTRRDVRFALSIIDEARSVHELANVMEGCMAGVTTSPELYEKMMAFIDGVIALTGAPVPSPLHLEWASA